ncbi:MAG TPA: YggT family protein [Syntrophales bacterium]|nr:YggT family protein [Syntrophales bacterium]
MFVLGNFIVAAAKIIHIILNIYMWIVIARALISWVNPDPYNQIVQFLYRITEPVLALVRRWLPFRGMGIDLSPLVVILAIYFIDEFLIGSLIELAAHLR